MTARKPMDLPYSNIHVEHKTPRKEKVVPIKHDTNQCRCVKFYCTEIHGNGCCGFCHIKNCEKRCGNDNTKCNCLTDEIHGKSTMTIVGGG